MASDSASDRPREVELKLLLPPGARAALERHPALREPRATPPEMRQEHTTYYDTPGLALSQKGLSLRVRRYGGQRVQTLKSAREAGGVAASRGEWEWSVSGDAPDLSRVAETPFGAEVASAAQAGLEPVFETSIERTVRTIDVGGTRAEAAIDEGQVRAGAAEQPVSELELELKGGAPGPLYRLALDLHGAVPFTLGAESKAERGRRLRTGEKPQAVESGPPALDGAAPAAEALRRIVGAELGHMLANQPAAAAAEVEGVHQMRVGIRRLRTALALFGRHLEPHAVERFQAELRRLGGVFGGARDWDVFCTAILPQAEADEAAQGATLGWAELLRAPAEAERREAHRLVQEELARPALTGLLLGMAAWVEPDAAGAAANDAGGGAASPAAAAADVSAAGVSAALGSAKLGKPLRKLAPSLLDRMARRVDKHGGGMRRRSAEELHDLRKALKKLRYGADYLAGLYPPKPVERHQKAAKRLLKLLGAGNDAAVAASLAERLAADGRAELAPAVGALAQWAEAQRRQAVRKLPDAWSRFAAAETFWR